MGNILIFNASAQRLPQFFAPDHSADILFFTGVRYVPYMGETSAPHPKGKSRRGGRRTGLGGKSLGRKSLGGKKRRA